MMEAMSISSMNRERVHAFADFKCVCAYIFILFILEYSLSVLQILVESISSNIFLKKNLKLKSLKDIFGMECLTN
jgi:hypothetical protein